MDWEDEASVGWFPNVRLTGCVLDIADREIRTGMRLSAMYKLRSGSERCPSSSSLGTERRWWRRLSLLVPLLIYLPMFQTQ